MNKHLTSCLFSVCALLLFTACARKTNTAAINPPATTMISIIPEPEKPRVLDSIHSQAWRWFYGKYSVAYSDGERKLGVKLSLKCSKDSAANALISFASIPFVNALIKSDSILYLNKKDRCYGQLPLGSLKKVVGIELSLNNLQELFLGLPIALSAAAELLPLPNGTFDTISFLQKDSALSVFYTYAKKSQRIVDQRMVLSDGRSMKVSYLSWNEGSINTPASILISVVDNGKESTIRITMDRYELNIPQEISVEIPQDYEKCP